MSAVTLKNKRAEEEQRAEEAQKTLIRARSLADAYQVAYTEDESAEIIMPKVDAAKAAGIQPKDLPQEYADYGHAVEPVEQRRGASISKPLTKKIKKEQQTEDIQIHTLEELAEHEATGKMKGWSGWFMDVKDDDGNVIDEVHAKNSKGLHGWIPGAKGVVQIVVMLLLAFMVCLSPAMAAVSSTDEGVLGNSRWRVSSSGHLIPATGSTYDIGASGTNVRNIYADSIPAAGDITGTSLTVTGDLTFRSTLLANGRGGASTVLASSSTPLLPTSLPYAIVMKNIGGAQENTTLQNGKPGQQVTFYVNSVVQGLGSWVITPTTSLNFTAATLRYKGESITLLYVNDTVGWTIVAGSARVFGSQAYIDSTIIGSVTPLAGTFTTLTGTDVVATNDYTFRSNLLANGRYGSGSTVLFSSSTTLQQSSLPYATIWKAIGNNATTETTLLPAGTTGQELAFVIYSCGGSGNPSWTLQVDSAGGVASIGWSSIKFTAVGQSAVLLYVNSTLGWQIKYVNAGTVTFPTSRM